MIAQASHEGCEEATFILNLMNKEKLTKRMYKNELKKDKNRFDNYLEFIRESDCIDDYDEDEYPF